MYDKSTNTITFPHIMPTNRIAGKEHTFNSINGGMTKLADLGIEQNSFLGGNVVTLGLIKEYGFYACPSIYNAEILGFYVHDPAKLTELGRNAIIERFPKYDVVFEIKTDKELTAEQIKERKAQRQRWIDEGISPEIVDHHTADELKNLLKVMQSGAAEKPMAVAEMTVQAPSNANPEIEGHKPAKVNMVKPLPKRSNQI